MKLDENAPIPEGMIFLGVIKGVPVYCEGADAPLLTEEERREIRRQAHDADEDDREHTAEMLAKPGAHMVISRDAITRATAMGLTWQQMAEAVIGDNAGAFGAKEE